MSTLGHDVRKRGPARSSLSRSPHPYHRRNHSLLGKDDSGSSTDLLANDTARSSESTDDLVLEADDEKGPLLRLPAPPLKPRKGLRGENDPSISVTPGISPLPSPRQEKPGFSFPSLTIQNDQQSEQPKDDLYVRYVKRRRREITRRVTETVLLLLIGLLSTFSFSESRGHGRLKVKPELLKWQLELIAFFATICSCYLLHPVRRAIRSCYSGLDILSATRHGFHVPSRFDPGILLYPVLLPMYMAASLGLFDDKFLVNIILGLSSMPEVVVPFARRNIYLFHWFLTLIPVFIRSANQTGIRLSHVKFAQIDGEEASLLFPLHKNLVQVITDTVATSLDPTEVQLLSVGLINLLLFASTPQAQILKGLLWVGGLCIFIFCELALRAEVSLARIPAWRFARNKPSNKGFKGRINRILRALLPESRSRFAVSSSSDSEDEISPMLGPPLRSRRFRHTVRRREVSENSISKTNSADEGARHGSLLRPGNVAKTGRSSTFSMYGRAAIMAVRWKNIAQSPNPYPRLNYLHARTLKILLAVYVYAVFAITILLPVKYFISQRALRGVEAIGWAIGYFIGDIPQVRLFVISNNLEGLIHLPINKSQISVPTSAAWVDRYRQCITGAANGRLLLAGYCIAMITIGIVVVLRLNHVVEVDTRRKVFHGVMVAMLLPTIPIDPMFFALALIIVLAVFLMLDLFRASQLPPISRPLTAFLAPYVDGRDHRGPVVVSHIFLLIGCAIPLWLSSAAARRHEAEEWELSYRDISMVSGVICVGMGDAAASLIGRRFGRTKWYWAGGKSLEGSAAFALAVMTGLMASWIWLRLGGWVQFRAAELPWAALTALTAGLGASLMESTLTAANDNVVVPIGLWLLVRGLQI